MCTRTHAAREQAQVGGAPLYAPSGSGVQWEWREFGNPARNDGLVLRHWSKRGQVQSDISFDKFNKKVAILKYSQEEYTKYLTVEDWDKKETDDLLAMAERYALNFIVIADRWPHNKDRESSRTTDQLKDRFYLTQRKLAEVKGLGAEADSEGVLLGHPFNKEWEADRKEHLLKSMQRSKAQERQDLAIKLQASKLEEAQRRARKPDLKKKKADPGDDDAPLCPAGQFVLRSSMVSKRAERAGVLKWLATCGTPVNHSSYKTQQVFSALCNNVVELLDYQKQVARKKKEADMLFDKKQELVRPLKKRKAAPNQKFSDAPGAGGAGAAEPPKQQQNAYAQPMPATHQRQAPPAVDSSAPAPQKKRKH